MRKKFLKLIVASVATLLSFTAAAIEPFKADCTEHDKTHRYDLFLGDGNEVIADGWMVESWWEEDTIIWNGGDTLLLNYGKMSLSIISATGTVLRAMFVDESNIYLLALDTSLDRAVLTQHQAAVFSRAIKARTAGLKCVFKTIDLGY